MVSVFGLHARGGAAVFGALFGAILQFHFTETEGDAGRDVSAIEGEAIAFAQQVGVGIARP